MTDRRDDFEGGLRCLETAAFWDAHEALEPLWKALPVGSARREAVQALIQFAAAGYKLVQAERRSEPRMQRGMASLIVSARAHVEASRSASDAGSPAPGWDLAALEAGLDDLDAVHRRWSAGAERAVCFEGAAALARDLAGRLRGG